jgi:hypothetical protein
MQRLWRDANAASAHHGLMWDIRGTEFARVLMGLPAAEQGPVTTYAQAGHTTPPDLSQVGVKLQGAAAASSGVSAQEADPTQRQGSTS